MSTKCNRLYEINRKNRESDKKALSLRYNIAHIYSLYHCLKKWKTTLYLLENTAP